MNVLGRFMKLQSPLSMSIPIPTRSFRAFGRSLALPKPNEDLTKGFSSSYTLLGAYPSFILSVAFVLFGSLDLPLALTSSSEISNHLKKAIKSSASNSAHWSSLFIKCLSSTRLPFQNHSARLLVVNQSDAKNFQQSPRPYSTSKATLVTF
jgi:hypothetical protein